MKPENYGLKLIQKYQPDAVTSESDLMGADMQAGDFRLTFSKMSEEERNKMREIRWMRDPDNNTWVYIPAMRENEIEKRA